MKRYGQVVRLKPESREEYIRCHRAVWPTVLTTIAECNIRNYSIFECGELLFESHSRPRFPPSRQQTSQPLALTLRARALSFSMLILLCSLAAKMARCRRRG